MTEPGRDAGPGQLGVETEQAPGRRAARPAAGLPGWLTWFTLERGVAIAVPALLVVMAIAPLEQVYLSARLWVTVGMAGLLGAAIAVAGAQRRWPTLTVLAVALPTFFLCGALAAPSSALGGVLPTLTTWRLMGQGVVTVWKQVLTIAPPLGSTGVLLLLPYLLTFFGVLIAVTVSLRARRWSLSLIVPAVVVLVAILFGTRLPVAAGVLGVLAVLLAVTWVAWRSGRLELHRMIAVPLVLGVAALGGTGASVLAVPDAPRFVLRDLVDPPPDPHDYPSPLAGFARYVDDLGEEVVLTATGLPASTQRVRLATMDAYDGRVWDISSSAPGSGTFTRSGERLVVDRGEGAARVQVTTGAYRDVWLPNIGSSLDVDFTSDRASDLDSSLYYNLTTDTGLVANQLRPGDSYTLLADPAPDVVDDPEAGPDSTLAQLPIAEVDLPDVQGVPDIVGSLASDYASDGVTPYERVSAIAYSLRTFGFFSNGLVGEPPSRPGHGNARLTAMLEAEEITGNAEQYAAVMALMVRSLGLPSRVVMGFEVPAADGASVEITGADVTAWVEVPFQGVGWVPFFPTPEEDQVPQTQDPDPQDRPEPQVLQPPDPPVEPPIVPPVDRSDADVEEEPAQEDDVVQQIVYWSAVVGIPLLVLLSPFLLILLLKARRRRRRRGTGPPTARIAGGWDELSDRVLDLGVVGSPGHTRQEAAGHVDGELSGAATVALARRADAGVFAPEEPSDAEVEAYWADVGSAVQRARRGVRWRRRTAATFSLRSLRRR